MLLQQPARLQRLRLAALSVQVWRRVTVLVPGVCFVAVLAAAVWRPAVQRARSASRGTQAVISCKQPGLSDQGRTRNNTAWW